MQQHTLVEIGAAIGAPVSGDVSLAALTHDTRFITPGTLWVAVPGLAHHGIEFIDAAVAAGVTAIASDGKGIARAHELGIPTIELADVRRDMGRLAAFFYGHPDRNLSICGITGTNGKTTTAFMVRHILRSVGKSVGMIGTLGAWIDSEHVPGVRTTPESTDLFALLADMSSQGVTHVAMEVSSHGLSLHRVEGMTFDVGVFTNLTQDHLDFHGSMEEYFAAKASLFSHTRSAVVNVDDSWGMKLASTIVDQQLITIGSVGQWVARDVESSLETLTSFTLHAPEGEVHRVTLNMLGDFNVTNAVTALAVCSQFGIDIESSVHTMSTFSGVPGRFEDVSHQGPGRAFVDYAHTPDAVDKVLQGIRGAHPETLITVIGCGGDRDSSKRYDMGRVASELSDVVIVTDDNPRSEDPHLIRAEVLRGAHDGSARVIEIGDRREAIRTALGMADTRDVVAVLGKGHEQGQEISDVVHAFDDREVIKQESAHA